MTEGCSGPAAVGGGRCGRSWLHSVDAGVGDDVVDEAVLEGFRRGEPAVAIGVGLDALEGLSGEFRIEAEHLLLDDRELLGLDGDVSGATGDTAERLV